MNSVRNARLAHERRQILKDRFKVLQRSIEHLLPEFPQMYLPLWEVAHSVQEIRQVIEPTAADFNESQLEEAIKVALPAYAERRMQQAREYFGELVRTELNIPPSQCDDPLSLAVGAYFICLKCRKQHAFPQILRHYTCDTPRMTHDEYGSAAADIFLQEHIWAPQGFSSNATMVAQRIRASGLDPLVATSEDMDGINVRLTCPTHDKCVALQRITVRSWRSASRVRASTPYNGHYFEQTCFV